MSAAKTNFATVLAIGSVLLGAVSRRRRKSKAPRFDPSA
jgi:hypothetical protein